MKIGKYDISLNLRKQVQKRNHGLVWVNVADQKADDNAKISRVIKYQQQLQRITQDISKWRLATKVAESILAPNRRLLYQTYKDVVLDAHLSGLIQSRKNAILMKELLVLNKAGEVDKAKTELFKAQWFMDFLNFALDSIYYGHSLIQFGGVRGDAFYDVELIPREYVKPEFHVVTDNASSQYGTPYLEKPYSDWCIAVGADRDLGLLLKASPLVIWKKNTIGAWSEYTEIFGSPVRIGRTDVRDAATRQNMIDMMQNMGSAAWGVFDKDDVIELLQGQRADAYKVYQELIKTCNEELSKLVLGNTMTSDNGSSRSQAEVHQEVGESFMVMDEMYMTHVIKDKLFPLMTLHGFGMDGFTPKFNDAEKLDSEAKMNIDKELMQFFDLDPKYIEDTYGTPVTKKETPEPLAAGSAFKKLKDYYS